MRRNRPALSDAELTAEAHRLLEEVTPPPASAESPPTPAKSIAGLAPGTPAYDRNRFPFGLPAIPMERRRINSGCGICGIVSPQTENRWTGTVGPTRIGTPGLWWGLPTIKGPSDKVSVEICRECEQFWSKAEAFHYAAGGTPAWVGFTVTERLRRLKRQEVADVPPAEIVPLDQLPGLTWTGHVVAARTEGRPDPTPPESLFGFIESGTIKRRQKEKS